MLRERQGVNPNEFVVLELPDLDKKETLVMTIEKVVDDGAGDNPFTLADRFLRSKSARSVSSAALAIFSGLASGSAMTANTAIVEQGEMPSQGISENLEQYNTLKPGSEGQEVEDLKQRMFDLGYFKNSSSVNKTFTTSTAEYVKKFEETNGLPVDGIADPEMQALFFSDKARKADGLLVVPEPYKPKEILPGSEEEKIINARFKSFLEGEGEFSDESLKDKMFFSYLKNTESDLGFCGVTLCEQRLVVQGVLLGHYEYGTNNYLIMGIKNKEGKRQITLAQLLVEEMIQTYSNVFLEKRIVTNNSMKYETNLYQTEKDLLLFLDNKLLDRVVLFGFYNFDYIDESKYDKKFIDYFNKYVIPKKETNVNFVSGLYQQQPKSKDLKYSPILDNYRTNQDIEVIKYSDMINQVANNPDIFPLLFAVEYFVGK